MPAATLSIIIPTYNGACQEVFPNTPPLLESLREQAPSGEIILVDSSKTDGFLSQIAERYHSKIYRIQQHEFDHGRTRMLAGKIASSEILVFVSHDIVLEDKHAIEKLIEPFSRDKKVAAVYGRQLPHANASDFAAHLRHFNYPDTSHVKSLEDKHRYGIKTPFMSNGFAAYRRSALEEIGWFKDKLIMSEDTYAGAKLLLRGYKIAYAAEACVHHSHNYSLLEEFKRYFDIGVFHRQEKWIVQEFGVAEGEGSKYVKSGLAFLVAKRNYYMIPAFVIRSIAKYVGYQLGLHYGLLPKAVIRQISMHRNWWKNG